MLLRRATVASAVLLLGTLGLAFSTTSLAQYEEGAEAIPMPPADEADPLGSDIDAEPGAPTGDALTPPTSGDKDSLPMPDSMPPDAKDGSPDPAQDAMMTPSIDSDQNGALGPEGYFGDPPGSESGLFGKLRIGPTFSLGVPHPITYGVDVTYDKFIGGGITVGTYKTEVENVAIKFSNFDVRVRWFPMRTSFFVGAAYGNQTLSGESSKIIGDSKTTLKLKIKTNYLTPHIGWFKTWDVGFTMGFELGYQLALSSKANLTTDIDGDSEAIKGTSDYVQLKNDTEDQGEKLGKKNLPYVTLMRLGWLL